MQRIRLFFLALFSLTAVSLAPAVALTNGPVSTTLGSTNYSVYYTAPMDFYSILTITATPSPGAKYPVGSIDGLGTNPLFMLPWWNPSSSAAALAAAQTWYNTSGWPINDGVRLPNSTNTETPYFAYGSGNSGFLTYYVALKPDPGNPGGPPIVIDSSVSSFDNISFALAGVSN